MVQQRLREKIISLKTERDLLEASIGKRLDGMQQVIERPAPYLKQIITDLASDREVQRDLLKSGAHYAADYLIDKLIPEERLDFVSSLLKRLQKKAGNGAGSKILDLLSGFLGKKD